MGSGESTAAGIPTQIRAGERVAIACLLVIAILIWVRIYDFSQQRFFTVDEYQYGHATWLVSEGRTPYVDFYEHHFPLGYTLHAAVLPDGGDFAQRALWLRQVSFGYAAAASVALGIASWVVARSVPMALLSACLPATFGFGLMSAIDYRADNFAAFGWLIVLALMEANTVWRRRAVAVLCGALTAVVVLMTQKMVFLAGGTLALMWIIDWIRSRRTGAGKTALVAFPAVVFWAGLLCGSAFLAIGAASGMLEPGWEYTIEFGFEHEALYHAVPLSDYAIPFLAETALSTVPLLLVCAVSLFSRANRFWIVPVVITLFGGALIRAQFPYNYVLPCYMLIYCAVRGFVRGLDRVLRLVPGTWDVALRPIALLLPLVIVPDQLGFVSGTTSNVHQLALLNKIEKFTQPGDSVIDGAGGALFRDHASWYWYHGSAHRKLWADYFESDLADDYRNSQSLFRIRDFRTDELPKPVRRYLIEHYVTAGGDLQALGFLVRSARDAPSRFSIDVVRPGDYFVHPILPGSAPPSVAPGRTPGRGGLAIDGARVEGGRVQLEVGEHRVRVDRNSSDYIISPLPAEVFQDLAYADANHTPLFEYERPR